MDINIFGAVAADGWDDTAVSAAAFSDQLSHAGPDDDITLNINSPGGSVFEGLTIYQTLLARQGKTHVVVHGVAASIASVIAMAGDSITMGQASRMMIHNPLGPSALAFGTADDLREAAEDTLKTADLLDSIKGTLIDVYQARTGADRGLLADWMESETWINAESAKENGFTDYVTPNKSVAACVHSGACVVNLKDVDELNKLAELASTIGEFQTGEGEREHAQNRLRLRQRKYQLTQ